MFIIFNFNNFKANHDIKFLLLAIESGDLKLSLFHIPILRYI